MVHKNLGSPSMFEVTEELKMFYDSEKEEQGLFTYTGFNEVPPPLILIIVSFIGEICGTFDKLSVGIGVWILRVSAIMFKQLS